MKNLTSIRINLIIIVFTIISSSMMVATLQSGLPVTAAATQEHVAVTEAAKPAQSASTVTKVVNSHSNLNPSDSFAYVADVSMPLSATQAIRVTPVTVNPKKDILLEPAGLTAEDSEAWLARAKAVATEDYLKTGREQEIRRVDATVATITIGSSSIPAVSAIDISSYQSWMTATDFKRLSKLGVRGCVVKLTEGNGYLNPYAANEAKLARNAGMRVTYYHYAVFTSSSKAASEAKYLVSKLKAQGVGKSTLIFADMENPSTINSSSVGTWLRAFWSKLSAYGYKNHGLYTSLGYANRDKMVSTVGNTKTWIAQYPYTPSKYSMQHSQYGAWQFSSTAQFSGMSNRSQVLDVSHDYKGILAPKAKTTYTSSAFNRYITITRNGGNIYRNFNWAINAPVSKYYHKTLLAKTAYKASTGATYYSLWDNAGKSIGYLNSSVTKVAKGIQGAGITDDRYVKVTATSGNFLRDFDGNPKQSVSKFHNQTVHVKGFYSHFNGKRYLSTYNNKGQWLGYLDSGLTAATTIQGPGKAYGKYLTISSNSSTLWANFSGKAKSTTKPYYKKTVLAKYIYHHFNGAEYASVYDGNNRSLGYINLVSTKLATGPWGVGYSIKKYVSQTSKTGYSWRSFRWIKLGNLSAVYHQTYVAKRVYYHFNGSSYYSLYNSQNQFKGYVNASVLKSTEPWGIADAINLKVKVTSKTGYIWKSFHWIKGCSASKYYGKTLTAKKRYRHYNGSTYLLVYDSKGRTLGYINQSKVK
ncbi:GH25 family lysozyme [Lacticaseibacillus nasuensis]|uniref:GH25 family lysozyme n=1 Tax=Lacticaseibacillus nasuensis TaxID=944671 RepID=UPI0022452007|nr:GH25 family lysozyme [Lacticaseibacillus nasuensis]MCX2456198.1 GH25 family lysozyme [Lacticaseibacillus nasuensis]